MAPARTLPRRGPLPFAGRAWAPVTVGLSGARVWRRPGAYLKVERSGTGGAIELVGEVERTRWLHEQGLAAAEVLDAGDDGSWTWMITAALPGRSLAEPWPAAERREVVRALAAATAALHALDTAACPFRRDLSGTVPAAAEAVRRGAVDLDDLDEDHRGRAAADLLADLMRGLPSSSSEKQDLVVCHGDLCAPNVLVDPDSMVVTGLVDLGRLGGADRHQDLALAVRSLAGSVNPQYGDEDVAQFLEAYAAATGVRADPARLEWFRLLDEFF